MLLWCGIIAGPLFIGTFLIEGTRPGYDAARLPISLLAVGPDGWTQVANFLVAGALVVGLAVGLLQSVRGRGDRFAAGPLLIAIFGAGLIAAGLFPTDPGGGYPLDVAPPAEPTTHSLIHDVASLVVFVSLPLACLAFANYFGRGRERRWAIGSLVTGVSLIVLFVLMLVGFNSTGSISDVAGLIQRAWVLIGMGWLFVLAVHELRRPSGASSPRA